MTFKHIDTFNSGGGIMLTEGSMTVDGQEGVYVLIADTSAMVFNVEGRLLTPEQAEIVGIVLEGDLTDYETELWCDEKGFNPWIKLAEDDKEALIKEANKL